LSRRRKNKNKRKPQKKRSSPFSNLNISKIADHTRLGSKLSPPLLQVPQTSMSSWADDHMPEMLWAVLLTAVFDRKAYLGCFRLVAIRCKEWFKRDETEPAEASKDTGKQFSPNHTVVVDQTTLAEVSNEKFREFLQIPLRHPLGYAALRPLLLIESLPGRDRWIRELNVEPEDGDWETLAAAVAGVLDHQSEQSTDIRWFKLLLTAISGHMHFHSKMSGRIEELRLFPDKGDMRSVRPFIRAGELTLRRHPPSKWIEEFWIELMRKTRCIDPTKADDHAFTNTSINPNTLYAARHDVIDRFFTHITAKRVDARLDCSFGLVLYGLSIIEEIGAHRAHTRIMGRLALRAVAEINITLRYLIGKNSDDLWRSYRVYGAGQAKLAFLKAQESEGDLPPFLDESALHEIANEDKWQEYLDIDVGHWADSNLRKLSIECGAKDVYDKYYDWTSGFTHGNWGAVRDTNFLTCHNPLHHLHRIPRLAHRQLNSVEVDAVDLVNDMIQRLDKLFSSDLPLGQIAMEEGKHQATEPKPAEPDSNLVSSA
jgi:hypothetical protein